MLAKWRSMMRIQADGVARLGLFPDTTPLFHVNDQIMIVSGIKLRASHL